MAAVAGTAAGAGSFFVAPSRPRIILFGDSLTERGFDAPAGWATYLAGNYTRRADVVNRGLSGYNTRWALQALPHVFGPPLPATTAAGSAADSAGSGGGRKALQAEHAAGQQQQQQQQHQSVLFATLWFGANDAARLDGPSHSARQHVPLEEYGNNLREIVSYMRAAGVERIVLITPPPVWEPGRKAHQIARMGEQATDWPLDRTQEVTSAYAAAAAGVAGELGLPCLDLQALLTQEDQWGERLLVDGLHFTPAGQELVWRLLGELLDREWPHARPQALPAHFPPWDAIDFANPGATFGAPAAPGDDDAGAA